MNEKLRQNLNTDVEKLQDIINENSKESDFFRYSTEKLNLLPKCCDELYKNFE